MCVFCYFIKNLIVDIVIGIVLTVEKIIYAYFKVCSYKRKCLCIRKRRIGFPFGNSLWRNIQRTRQLLLSDPFTLSEICYIF